MKRMITAILSIAVALSTVACGRQEARGSVPAADMTNKAFDVGQEAALLETAGSGSPAEAGTAQPQQEATPIPTESPEPSPDPYGLGADPADIEWDAVVFDMSGDMLEDGWPSIYLNLAQVVWLEYDLWTQCGWHKLDDGSDDCFLDILAEANVNNREVWQSFGDNLNPEVKGLVGPKAEAPFSVSEETKYLMLLLDSLTMEQLAALLEEPALQPYLSDSYNASHNSAVAEWVQAHTGEPEEGQASGDGGSQDEMDDFLAYLDQQDPDAFGGYAEEAFAAENGLTMEQYQAVKPIIQSIASDALAAGSTDLEHVRAASRAIYSGYVVNAVYGYDGSNYMNPYGLLIEGQYSCAGTAKTMAMVLNEMGYPVTYYNKDAWAHQWVETTLDGQHGWAECMGGIADYGDYPFPCYNPEGTYTDPETGEVWQLGGYE